MFKLTKAGQAFIGRPDKIFGILAPFFLFQIDHGYLLRDDRHIDGNWEFYLNALNVETQNDVAGAEIRKALYGAPKADERYDHLMRHLAIEVLSALCWMGLMYEHRTEKFYSAEGTVFTKTHFWKSVLRLASYDASQQATLH